MPFISPDEMPKVELFPGGRSALIAGDRLLFSFLEMDDGAELPAHSHPEEQGGLLLTGCLRLRIGDEEQTLYPGDAFIVPPNVVHSAVVEDGPVNVLDTFAPPRPDYLEKIAEQFG